MVVIAGLIFSPVVVLIFWAAYHAGGTFSKANQRSFLWSGCLLGLALLIGGVLTWFSPRDVSNDAQGWIGASAIYGALLLWNGIVAFALTLPLGLTAKTSGPR